MKPERLPRTVTLLGTVYLVRVSPCPFLWVRDDDHAEPVRSFLDPLDRTVLLPAGTAAADWPAIVVDLEEHAAFNAVSETPAEAAAPVVWIGGRGYRMELTDAADGYALDGEGERCMCVRDDEHLRLIFSRHITPAEMLAIVRDMAEGRDDGGQRGSA